MHDEIAKSLGLNPIVTPVIEAEIVDDIVPAMSSKPVMGDQDPAERDFQYARDNFYNVIEKGTQALEQMLDVAKASEHPRAYEVVSTIMKTLVDANKDLVSMSAKRAEAEKPTEESNKRVTNNNLFVGSTSELQQLLKDLRNNGSSD